MKKIILSFIIILIAIYIPISSFATTSEVSVSNPKNVELDGEFTVKLNLEDIVYAAQANVKITYSNGNTEESKIVYIKEFEGTEPTVTFKAKVKGLAKITLDNIILSDENSNKLDISGKISSTINVKQTGTSEYTSLPIQKVGVDAVYVTAQTTVQKFLNTTNFPNINSSYNVKILSSSNEERNSEAYICSNDIIQVKSFDGANLAEYVAVVKGDINGDGKVRMLESFDLLRDIIRKKNFNEVETLIRDYDEDGRVRMLDAFDFCRYAIKNR